MRKTRLYGTSGPVCYALEEDEPFPHVSTEDTTYFFVTRGGRTFRVHQGPIDIVELGRPQNGRPTLPGLIGRITPDGDERWTGSVGDADRQDPYAPADRFLPGEKSFQVAADALIERAGDVMNEELQTLRRLAAKYSVPLPERLPTLMESK